MYCKCGEKIPEARVQMGYNTCVECSKEDRWSCNPLTFHKTGNTIEIIKDVELAQEVAAKSSRRNFGVMRGITGSYTKIKTPPPKQKLEEEPEKEFIVVKSRRKVDPSVYEFDAVGNEAFAMKDSNKNIEEIELYLSEQVQKIRISPQQKKQLIQILSYI